VANPAAPTTFLRLSGGLSRAVTSLLRSIALSIRLGVDRFIRAISPGQICQTVLDSEQIHEAGWSN
jgi:hypothetical protein